MGSLKKQQLEEKPPASLPSHGRRLFCFVRWVLVTVLVALFLWQTTSALEKYIDKATSINYEEVEKEKQHFPSLSFCSIDSPLALVAANKVGLSIENMTFVDALAARSVPPRIVGYRHKKNEFLGPFSSSDGTLLVPSLWSRSFGLSPFGGMMECHTYSPRKQKFVPAYPDMFSARMDVESDFQGMIYVHSPSDGVLIPANTFGRKYALLPQPKAGVSKLAQYQISFSENYILSKEDLPCHADEEEAPTVIDCLEEYFQEENGCTLLWRNETTYSRQCATAEDFVAFSKFYGAIMAESEVGIFKRTGCHKACFYKSFQVEKTGHEESSGLNFNGFNTVVWINLVPGAIMVETEVMAYDIYDLVGNVGGFLGLFLGASILSLFDGARAAIVPRMKMFLK